MPRHLAFLIIVRGRGQREILKNPRPTGSWQPFKSIFGKRKKRPSAAGRKPRPCPFYVRKNQTGAVCGSYRASFYHGAKIRNSAVLPLAGNLLGSAFPKPCYGGLRRKNISATATKFLGKFVRCKVRGCLEPAAHTEKNFKRSRTNAEKMSVVSEGRFYSL